MTDVATRRESAGAAERGAWDRWRPVLMRLHFYGGMLAGPFILMAALTGLLYTLTPQLDAIAFRHELTVDATAPARASLSDQIAAARQVYPDTPISSVKPPTVPSETTQIAFDVPGLADGYTRTVFVNPYTAHVQGTLTTYGQWMPIRSWFDELHRTLHLGTVGRFYSETAASWLWVAALGGVALWVAHVRRARRGARGLVVPDLRGRRGSRRRAMNWHGAVGICVAVGLLGLSVTGLTWSRFAGDHVSALRAALTWTTPSVSTRTTSAGTGAFDGAAGADTALHSAEAAGLRAPMWMTPPSAPGEAWQVAERKRDFPTRGDAVAVDPRTGTVVDEVRFRDWPLTAKLTRWAIDAHMGLLFGVANQVALAALALGLITVVVRGYLMWWRRRPTRAAPPRGALAGLRPGEAVAAIAALALVGWFAPLFGATLGMFVLGDVAAGALSRRRAGA
ncbi:PepSY-associated TM helix domain-containing protein [Tsukamurella sp. 8F]|uniref:PepSY-associated TM helix domain-containing protein n=1 Tax=unclassified Tsukamurella TaxID=2633480 RepID=UPI0023B9E3DA|nr:MULTISPECIES: PepSY-associated TM helix domain-containing protein [unclassified Tsukamurella]MDF0528734.1 PepSY-associated TM helix domain-containing protein [Tsukamurella sp. 8J]MDF0585696.1 PepSY-associated TM helix domain-containing protein [Tsukamurella sp. 8F]